MQFEDFDNKLRQAADQHHPSYDEQAWAKMEKMLDQHMPLNNDRRRRFLFLLLAFLLVGGGAWLIYSKPWQSGTTASDKVVSVDTNSDITSKTSTSQSTNSEDHSSQQQSSSKDSPSSQNTSSATETKSPSGVITADHSIATDNSTSMRTQKTNSPNKTTISSGRQNKNKQSGNTDTDQASFDVAAAAGSKKNNQPGLNDNASPIVGVPSNINNATTTKTDGPTETLQPAPGNDVNNKPAEQKKEVTVNNAPVNKTAAASKKANSTRKKNYLFFSFSLGPDLSYIDLNEPGDVKLLSGAGVGYTFKDRWTIRTGFYAASKVYTANKYNYKPDNGVVNPNALDRIDANCKVYEVPLNVLYNFSRPGKHSFFASAGLSSFFMKKEQYRYHYKYPGPPPTSYTYTKTLENENKHYFSVLGLSIGYAINLNKTFSLSAEPYVKLPLAGIGYGHVKLNSGGIMFSVIAKPFH